MMIGHLMARTQAEVIFKGYRNNSDNVKNLERIWVHRSGDYHAGLNWTEDVIPDSSQQTSFQATPILVNETLYYCTPYNRIFALTQKLEKKNGFLILKLI